LSNFILIPFCIICKIFSRFYYHIYSEYNAWRMTLFDFCFYRELLYSCSCVSFIYKTVEFWYICKIFLLCYLIYQCFLLCVFVQNCLQLFVVLLISLNFYSYEGYFDLVMDVIDPFLEVIIYLLPQIKRQVTDVGKVIILLFCLFYFSFYFFKFIFIFNICILFNVNGEFL
jgi:hypothetical protein